MIDTTPPLPVIKTVADGYAVKCDVHGFYDFSALRADVEDARAEHLLAKHTHTHRS